MKSRLSVFCKQPAIGKVKTRLARELGDELAVRLYDAFLTDIIDSLGTCADERLLCYTPDTVAARAEFERRAAGDFQCLPQVEGDLGDRLTGCFRWAFADGPCRAMVVGSDSPTISPGLIRQALVALDSSDAVLGRSDDGGYYLIGLNQLPANLFTGIDWSTPGVYDQQVHRLIEAGLTISTLASIPEVDTRDDLERLRDHASLRTGSHTELVLSEIPRR